MSEKAKIRRGAEPRHKRPVTQPPRRGGQAARAPRAAAAGATPATPAALRRAGRWAVALLVGAGLVAGLTAVRVPQMAGTAVAGLLGQAGLVVRRVEITGLHHMDRLTVYSAAFDQESMAMPLVDLQAIRARLLRNGWIEDARVSRRLPDTLLIDIVERRPAAIWQYRGRLTLVDRAGIPLAPVAIDHMPDLPLVIGRDANLRTAELSKLIAAAPALKPMFSGASWIGGRRWDVTFQSGETLALPEGAAAAAAAIAKFARIDQATGLLGRGAVRFDMRLPGRIYVRTTTEPGKVAAPLMAPAPPAAAPPAPGIPAAIPPSPPAHGTAAPDAT